MMKKLILFAFSPFVAVMLMVLPDALVVANKADALPESVSRMVDDARKRDVDMEWQAWNGNDYAVRSIGYRCASTPEDYGWKASFAVWNQMICTFLLPFAAFILAQFPILLVVFAVDRIRIATRRPPMLLPRAMSFMQWLKRQFHLMMVLWMFAAYYVYRYWALTSR